MRTCRRWRDTVLEEPELLPVAVVRFPEPECDIWHESQEFDDYQSKDEIAPYDTQCARRAVRVQLRHDAAADVDVVRAAAQLYPRTARVRLEGSGAQVS